MRKRILSLLLAICLVTSMLPHAVFAIEEIAGGTFGDGFTWSLDDEGTLTISGTGEMTETPWLDYQYDINRVIISEGITNIPDQAFYDCTNLQDVSIPGSVVSIGYGAFGSCTSLTQVQFPEGLVTIGENAFNGCTSLARVVLPDSVTEIGDGAFSSCMALVDIELPEGLRSIKYNTFAGCIALPGIVIPDSVIEIGEAAFHLCITLASVNIPDGVTQIGDRAFSDCRSLADIDLPDGLDSIGGSSFYGCENLKRITIPASVTSISEDAFGGGGLRQIVFEGSAPVIEEYAFRDIYPTIFHPSDDATWNEETKLDYGGSPIWTDISVASIEVEDLSLVQESKGHEKTDYIAATGEYSDAYFYYEYDPDITVTLTDGTVYQGNSDWVYFDDFSVEMVYEDGQNYETPWSIGNHEVTAFLGQAQTTFTVTITENPVERIEVEPVTLRELCDGYWDGYWDDDLGEWVDHAWFCYRPSPESITVYYKDGTVQTSSVYEMESMTGYDISYSSNQGYDNQWGVGTYTATAKYMGLSCEYQVIIAENPVERIEAEPITLYEGVDGYMDGYWDDNLGEWVDNAWFRYRSYPENITVYYKDGTSHTYSVNELETLTGYYVSASDDQEYDAQWSIGTHTATAEYMGHTCEYQVIIRENPVSGVEIIQMPDKTTFWVGEMIDLKGAVLRVYFSDDNYEDIRIDRSTAYMASDYYQYTLDKVGISSELSLLERTVSTPGNHAVELEFVGHRCEIEVEIAESTISEISIESANDKEFQIVAIHEDGSVQNIDVVWLEDVLGDGTPEFHMLGGNLSTDQGVFFGIFYQMTDGSVYLEADLGPGGSTLRSNTLSRCRWLENWERIRNYIETFWCMVGSGDRFEGELTAENIDDLIEIMRCYENKGKYFYNDSFSLNYEQQGEAFVYAGDEIRAALKEVFGIEDVDLSLSSNYDLETDTYATIIVGWGSGPYEVPPVIEEKNGFLQITTTSYDGTKIQMLLDDAYRIKAYNAYDADHTHAYTETVTAPTCTEGGYTTYLCTCGDSYLGNPTDPLGHNFVNGICTICDETVFNPVVMNITTGDEYATLLEAIKAANNGETLILESDCTEEQFMLLPGVTLDLNGFILIVDYCVAFESAHIVDNIGTGRLVAGIKNVVLDESNLMIPVYTGDAYVFAKVGFALRQDKSYTGEGVRINALAYPVNMDVVELLKDGSEDNNIQITLRLSWDTDQGTGSQEFLFRDDVVAAVYSSNKGSWNSYGKMFSMIITGFDAIDNLKACLVVVSGTDVRYASSTSVSIS